MSQFDGSPWMELYRAAILELDPAKLPARVDAAYQAVQQRTWELTQQANTREEQTALRDAMQNLRVLQKGISPGQ